MVDVRRAVSGRSWVAFGVAVSTALLPICGLACAFPLDGSLAEPHQAEVPQAAECSAHADPGPEHGSNQNAPAQPCKQSHNNGVKIGSLTAKSSHGALPVVLVGYSFAPLPASELIVTGPSVAFVPPSFSPCIAPGFLDSGLTVFASTRPRPARRGHVAPGRGFDSGTSPTSTVRYTSA